MKVLVVHNGYQQRGGEDAVVEAEVALLRRHSHEVAVYTRHNDELPGLGRLAAATDAIWSRRTSVEVSELLRREQPDVVHVHNTFPLISPSLYWASSGVGIPVVQTLHNFRLLCPQAMLLREGRVCEDCVGKLPWRGVVRACYRGSKAQSAVLAGMLLAHRGLGTWREHVSRYIALTEFSRSKFIEGGLPADRLVVKPNFVDFDEPAACAREGFLFVGRLAEEKGLDVLVRAVETGSNVSVKVAGAGPEAHRLDGTGAIRPLGPLARDEVRSEMGRALALVLPSICYENFPLTLAEAYASALPVIASRIGALAELVEEGVTGLLFEVGDPQDLALKMQWAQAHPERMREMGRTARQRYEARFTGERNHEQLMAIYADAIREAASRRRSG